MPKPRPLPGGPAARRTLAHRFTGLADRLRQFNTRFGLRPYRVFLCWQHWGGARRGEGDNIITRFELVPTPRVSDLTALTRTPRLPGVVPDGAVRVDQISAGAVTEDNLRGLVKPGLAAAAPNASQGTPVNQKGKDKSTEPRTEFWYELVEDGRGDDPAARQRFRLLGGPFRMAGNLQYTVLLQRSSEDTRRDGKSQVDEDEIFR